MDDEARCRRAQLVEPDKALAMAAQEVSRALVVGYVRRRLISLMDRKGECLSAPILKRKGRLCLRRGTRGGSYVGQAGSDEQ